MAQKAIHVNLAPTDPKNIAAGDDAAILSGIIGSALASSSGILAFGERLNLTKVTDNSVKVASGIYLNQGHAVRVTSDEVLTVLSGTQGKQRIDLIVSEYRKGAERDTHVIKTIQGSLFDADPEAPSLQAENLHGAGTVRQEEIGRIVFNGTSIASVAKTAKTISGLVELTDSIADHNHDTKYLGKTAKAADSAKLDGYTVSWQSAPDTIVRRTDYETTHSKFFAEDGVSLENKYLKKDAKATDSAKLDGYEQSGENTPSTIVRRTTYGTVHATAFAEDGVSLENKYLKKDAKATDSAKLDGREVSWEPVAGGIPRWSSPEKAIKADEFRENDVKLENKYLQTTAPRPSTYNLNNLLTPGIFSSQETQFVNYPKGANYSGGYGTVLVLRRDDSSGRNQIYLDSNGDIFSRYGDTSDWGDWITLSGALYGTGAPPSSLLPGQIYIQY